MYHLDEIDLAGNRYTILEHNDFSYICKKAIAAKRVRPYNVYVICNPDRVDIDNHNGLTEKEQELLP